MTEKEYQFWFSKIEGLGIKQKQLLLDYFGGEERIFQASKSELLELDKKGLRCSKAILEQKHVEEIKKEFQWLQDREILFLTKRDIGYPERLKHLTDAPYAIYVKGKVPSHHEITIAVVGARECSGYGKELAQYFAKELSKEGVQVISGLARGIDRYAHQGAILGNAPTFAVLGTGIDICYPAEHISLYMEIIENGGIISEYGKGIKGKPWHFPMRNRIISGLSDGILIVEAKEKSGSLITADLGLEQGKNIFAIPGRAGDSLSSGCNNLIRMGAELVTKPEEILNHYKIQYKRKNTEWRKDQKALNKMEKAVYASINLVPKYIDVILEETGFTISELVYILMRLELNGYIKQTVKNYYICCIE